ncbi:hypothetical protein Ndes2526B_g02804 [Nannochloris sp. 'desiccata']
MSESATPSSQSSIRPGDNRNPEEQQQPSDEASLQSIQNIMAQILQLKEEREVAASASVGACRDWESNSPSAWDTCETWRSIFLISSSTAFFLDILALLLTVGAIMGV